MARNITKQEVAAAAPVASTAIVLSNYEGSREALIDAIVNSIGGDEKMLDAAAAYAIGEKVADNDATYNSIEEAVKARSIDKKSYQNKMSLVRRAIKVAVAGNYAAVREAIKAVPAVGESVGQQLGKALTAAQKADTLAKVIKDPAGWYAEVNAKQIEKAAHAKTAAGIIASIKKTCDGAVTKLAIAIEGKKDAKPNDVFDRVDIRAVEDAASAFVKSLEALLPIVEADPEPPAATVETQAPAPAPVAPTPAAPSNAELASKLAMVENLLIAMKSSITS